MAFNIPHTGYFFIMQYNVKLVVLHLIPKALSISQYIKKSVSCKLFYVLLLVIHLRIISVKLLFIWMLKLPSSHPTSIKPHFHLNKNRSLLLCSILPYSQLSRSQPHLSSHCLSLCSLEYNHEEISPYSMLKTLTVGHRKSLTFYFILKMRFSCCCKHQINK